MFREESTLAEGLATFVTLKGVLTLGRLFFGDGGAVVAFPALTTFTWPPPTVDSLMATELCTVAKGFPTLVALEGLHPGVNLLMLSQVFAAVKSFLAFVTLKAFLIEPLIL